MRGAQKRRIRAFNDMMTAVYYGAMAPYQKPVPPLKDFLSPETPKPRRMPWQEIKAVFQLALGPGTSV